MTIREGNERDLEDLTGLLKLLTEREASFDFDEKAHREGLRQLIAAQPRVCVAVAEEEGRIAGMCTAQTVISTAMGGPSAWVEDVVVHPDFRRRGLGSDLLAYLEKWALTRGARRLQLLIDNDNGEAREFYRARAWEGTNFSCLRKLLREIPPAMS